MRTVKQSAHGQRPVSWQNVSALVTYSMESKWEKVMNQKNLENWHRVVAQRDEALLHSLLDEKVEFHSPTIWQPKQGREITHAILMSVMEIFENFQYHRQWLDGDSCALEFSANVADKGIKGIDLIRWNDNDKICHFEVMVRPINGLQLLFEKMTKKLHAAGFVPPANGEKK